MLGGAPRDTDLPSFREATGVTIDPDESQWRSLTAGPRDLTPLTQSRMQSLAAGLWESNLFAHQLIELPIAYLLAEGVRLTVPDKDAQPWLDACRRDPITDMRRNLPRMMRELALFGEQCWPTFVDPVSGHVRLGYLDPSLIETVVCDPENAAQPIGVVTTRDKHGRARRYRVVVAGPETVFAERTREIRETMTDGDAFLFQRNRLMCGARGRSDLLAAID